MSDTDGIRLRSLGVPAAGIREMTCPRMVLPAMNVITTVRADGMSTSLVATGPLQDEHHKVQSPGPEPTSRTRTMGDSTLFPRRLIPPLDLAVVEETPLAPSVELSLHLLGTPDPIDWQGLPTVLARRPMTGPLQLALLHLVVEEDARLTRSRAPIPLTTRLHTQRLPPAQLDLTTIGGDTGLRWTTGTRLGRHISRHRQTPTKIGDEL